jgi:hypothetical protein
MKVPADVLADLPDFREWADGEREFDLWDYAMCVATPDLFLALLEVLEPELVLHDGEYFLAHGFSAEVYEQWCQKLDDKLAIQRVINHLHISSLFQGRAVPDRVAAFAATHLARHWSLVFADKGLVGEAYGDNLDEAEVTLCRRPK